MEFPEIQNDESVIFRVRIGETRFMLGRFSEHLTGLINQTKGARACQPYFDTLLKQFPEEKTELGYVFPTFGCLFIDAVSTGKGDQASKIRAVGEAYFKRAAVYNSFDANFQVINPEFVAGADLFVYENRN